MNEAEIKGKIREFILTDVLPGESSDNLKDDTLLRSSGLIDSISTLRLVTFVEETFGIELEAHEVGVESFDCLNDMCGLVVGKKS